MFKIHRIVPKGLCMLNHCQFVIKSQRTGLSISTPALHACLSQAEWCLAHVFRIRLNCLSWGGACVGKSWTLFLDYSPSALAEPVLY